MKKTILFSILVTLSFGGLFAQGRTLTFTSVTDAKFFVYINGKLQNEHSKGIVTVNNLEDKEYHVRIVIDDPFVVATTKRIRPDAGGSEYTVRFNAVREKVYLKKSDSRSNREEESNWTYEKQNTADDTPAKTSEPRKRKSIRRNEYSDTATEKIINTINKQINK